MPGIPLYLMWLVAVIALVVIEAVTLGLTCIWFALGALAALILALISIPPALQVAAFVIVSALCLFLLKPFAAKHLYTNKTATNADRVIGASGVVTEDIDNEIPAGLVMVNGQTWTARSACDGVRLPKGTHVSVREISGVKLIVESTETSKECAE